MADRSGDRVVSPGRLYAMFGAGISLPSSAFLSALCGKSDQIAPNPSKSDQIQPLRHTPLAAPLPPHERDLVCLAAFPLHPNPSLLSPRLRVSPPLIRTVRLIRSNRTTSK